MKSDHKGCLVFLVAVDLVGMLILVLIVRVINEYSWFDSFGVVISFCGVMGAIIVTLFGVLKLLFNLFRWLVDHV